MIKSRLIKGLSTGLLAIALSGCATSTLVSKTALESSFSRNPKRFIEISLKEKDGFFGTKVNIGGTKLVEGDYDREVESSKFLPGEYRISVIGLDGNLKGEFYAYSHLNGVVDTETGGYPIRQKEGETKIFIPYSKDIAEIRIKSSNLNRTLGNIHLK